MQYNESKLLAQMQAELIDTKVELAVNRAIGQVVDQIVSLKYEVHREIGELKEDMRREIGGLKGDMIAVKTRLGMTIEPKDEIRKRLIEYSFKTVWIIGFAVASYLLGHLHFFH
jgi:hypothetical protein